MSQTVITQAFEELKAQEAANGGVVTLDEFVFASVPDLNITDPIDRTEGLPPAAQIVHRQAVSKTGMVNSNAVVYSVVLGADVGDFEFNWVGLLNKASGVVAMIVHAPSQKKIRTQSGQQGNVLTRSFLMEYNGASQQTQIITPADTWQIDFTARLNGVDERVRIENIDTYGAAAFLGDGFKVSKSGTKYAVKQGVAYIAGLRAELLFNQDMTVSALPSRIWADVCWQGTMTSVWAAQTKLTVAETLADYTENDTQHHVFAIAEILADGSVRDLRPVSASHALMDINPEPDTFPYFDSLSKARLTPLSAFVRLMMNKADGKELIDYLGLSEGGAGEIADESVMVKQPVPGAVRRSQHDKNADFLTVSDYGSGRNTDQVSDEAFLSALANSKIVTLADGTYLLSDAFDIAGKDMSLRGVGELKSGAYHLKLDGLTYHPATEGVFYTPGSFLREYTGVAYPTRPNPNFDGLCYRFVLSPGSKLGESTKKAQWVTAVGNAVGLDPEDWQMVDAFGTNAMIYAGRVSRSTAIGSEVMAWFGARSKADLIKNCHDFWRKPTANPYVPGEAGWNGAELETEFPGIGQRLADFTGYVTDPEFAGYCTGIGRDALNHIVAGVRNSAGGYGALQHLFSGSNNTAFGALALQSMVFGEGNTGIGDQAGRYANDCYNVVYIGYGAGRTVRNAQSSVFIGDRTADGVKSATRAVIIGPEAGRNHPFSLDNKFILANQPYGGSLPLLSGDFSSSNVGVNILPENVRARFHIRYASSGSTLTPPVGALIEGASVAALTLESTSAGFCQIRFADPESTSSGLIEYSHASDSLTFGTGGISKYRIESGGALIPMVDATQTAGRASFRFSEFFAKNGTINTSDGREKTQPVGIESLSGQLCTTKDNAVDEGAIFRAWADVSVIAFQWLSSIGDKGEDLARWHFGVIAQQVRDALLQHGIDGTRLGLLCYDEWEDEFSIIPPVTIEHPAEFSALADKDGNNLLLKDAWVETITPEERIQTVKAGNRWGVRPDQCLWLEAAYQRRRFAALEARVSALEQA